MPALFKGKRSSSTGNLDHKAWELEKQGRLAEAEMLYSRHALRCEKRFGQDNLTVAADLDQVVRLLLKEGKLEQAEPLCRRSLEIKENLLRAQEVEATRGGGSESQREEAEQSLKLAKGRVATALITLGKLMEDTARLGQATELFESAHELRKACRGPDHEETVTALAWMGDARLKVGDLEGAQTVFEDVVRSYERFLGKDDINVASALNNLAGLHAARGNLPAALPLFVRSHDIYVSHLGEDHPHSLATGTWIQQLETTEAEESSPPKRDSISSSRRGRGVEDVIEEGKEGEEGDEEEEGKRDDSGDTSEATAASAAAPSAAAGTAVAATTTAAATGGASVSDSTAQQVGGGGDAGV